MFSKQFLTHAVYTDWCYHAIHKHSSRSLHISVLIACTFMFRQFCTIESSFFNKTSGMHRRPFEGRHLVSLYYDCICCFLVESNDKNMPMGVVLAFIICCNNDF